MDFHRGIILNIDKPPGWTSFDVVRVIRSLTRTQRVGHSGTLDPMAVGVLLICTGKATRRVIELQKLEKEYEAEIVLGFETDSLDVTGSVVATAKVQERWDQRLPDILPRFVGEIMQVPPIVSALKQGGKPLYKLARKGLQIRLEPRPIQINGIELLACEVDRFRIRVRCSKGTYVRSLARDIAVQLGTRGTLSALVRTRIGPYTRKDAWTIAGFRGLLDTLQPAVMTPAT